MLAASACWGAAAQAQTSATVSLFNDLRFRGYSLSEGRPVAIFDFAYDDSSGFYADGSASGVLRSGGKPAPLGLQLTGGYAKRLKSETTLDVGITRSAYSHYSDGVAGKSYTEVYAGISRGLLTSRLFLSPHYFRTGHPTAYGELDAAVSPATDWRLDAHVGMLVPLQTASGAKYHRSVDWRLGASRTLGRVSLQAAWVGHARAPAPFTSALQRRTSRNRFIFGITTLL